MANTQPKQGSNSSARVVPHPAAVKLSPARLLERLGERWQSFANDHLRQLLLDIDDDLFARADSAENSVAQELYFNAMRLLRYQTDEVRSRFAVSISKAHDPDAATDQTTRTGEADGLEARLAELSLIDEDVLEQRLAVSTMTQRFERAHTLEVLLAQRRIEALRAQVEPSKAAESPALDANSLAEAFAAALAPLDLDLRIRLILFKHFENQVMEPLAKLFAEFNALLVDAGILPNLDLSAEVKQPRKSDQTPPPPAPAPSPSSGVPTAPAETRAPQTGTPTAVPASLPPGFDLEGTARRRSALMQKLPALQQRRRFAPTTDAAQLLDVGTVLQLIETSQRIAQAPWRDADLERQPERLDLGALLLAEAERNGRKQAALQGADEDTVNLLQMLFDLILSDEQLAIPMRALIARLQLPLLRVALMDAGFFTTARHPARRFLNAVSRAGMGWAAAEEKARDRLYAGIEALVLRAGDEFKGDLALFDTLREELDALLASEAQRIEQAASRVVELESRRIAAERTRLIVTRLVEHRLAQAPQLPDEVATFLKRDWQQVLMRAHGNPEAWNTAFAVLRRLTGSGSGPEGSALHSALISGLSLLSMTAATASTTAADILSHWIDADDDHAEAASEDPQTELTELTARIVNESEAEPAEQAPSQAAIAAAEALQLQQWVELQTRNGKLVRCRLAAITEAPERYIFLNRRGLRIDTLSRIEIAKAIEQERLRSLDDRQLFDRALERVIAGLRSAPETVT